MDDEVWVDIDGYDGMYQVSNHGRVRSFYHNSHSKRRRQEPRILRPGRVGGGEHLAVGLPNPPGGMKRGKLHQLVLAAFVGPYPPGQDEIRHLDGDPANNRLSNLAYGTRLENRQDSIRHGTQIRGERVPSAKLTAQQVAEIRSAHASGGYTQRRLAEQFGVTHGCIQKVIYRRSWTHV